ncbi:hypothetical protein R1flu_027369 [Riccia fluitans]|uniref:Uncharacterized protein n=1 Tax=Riccia fluitans TaxID=41844 RepID=A0ABD1XIP4_9MARC
MSRLFVLFPRLRDFGLTFLMLGGKKAFWAKILHEEIQRLWKEQDYTYLSGFVSIFYHGMKWLTPKDEHDLGFVRDKDEDDEDAIPMTPSPNFIEVTIQAEEAPTIDPSPREETIKKEKGKDTIVEEEIPVEPIPTLKEKTTKANEQKETQSRERKPESMKMSSDRPKSRLKIGKSKIRYKAAGFMTPEEA